MKNYFQHLSKNSPSNTSGSCGYVSFAQYLSYLDTFVNLENGNVILSSSDLELLKLGKIDVKTFYQDLVEKYYE